MRLDANWFSRLESYFHSKRRPQFGLQILETQADAQDDVSEIISDWNVAKLPQISNEENRRKGHLLSWGTMTFGSFGSCQPALTAFWQMIVEKMIKYLNNILKLKFENRVRRWLDDGSSVGGSVDCADGWEIGDDDDEVDEHESGRMIGGQEEKLSGDVGRSGGALESRPADLWEFKHSNRSLVGSRRSHRSSVSSDNLPNFRPGWPLGFAQSSVAISLCLFRGCSRTLPWR